MGWFLFVCSLALVYVFFQKSKKHQEENEELNQRLREIKDFNLGITNAEIKANQIIQDARIKAEQEATDLIKQAELKADQVTEALQTKAKDAYQAIREAKGLKEVIIAMRNIVEGYGDRYLKPNSSLLDSLAEQYSFNDFGKQLKKARKTSEIMITDGTAAESDYADQNRRKTAIDFILDAFNGKVDSILSKTRKDNYGILEQQIKDAYALVNYNGVAFRQTRITEKYLQARLHELQLACVVIALQDQERQERREKAERLREEERSRREIEKAIKEAKKEESTLEQAMEKVRQQAEQASAEQRQRFEQELQDLQQRLKEAEARNQRALSMAQQTKAGHVYVISNIGAFGEGVYKIGMTRRLEPMDRVRELGDASVPFAFDVHAMMWSEDAPSLERDLHQAFAQDQVNLVNSRKEFFRLDLQRLREVIEAKGIKVSWVMEADAPEYRQSLALAAGYIPEDDYT